MNFSSADLLIVGVIIHGFGVLVSVVFLFFLFSFFLFALEIGEFHVCRPLETSNGPLKAGFVNWM